MTLGRRIQEIRRSRGLTLTELAEQAAVAKSYLSTIERDLQKNPSLQVMERLSSVLHIDLLGLVDSAGSAPAPGSAGERPAENGLDPEWLELVRQARLQGVTKEEFRLFLGNAGSASAKGF
ncbi:transcriptional regulator [Paenibacillus sp. J31TS4]|uniref:helix-turn-helix domain-containing protein n=1 Tax=Paenibacillus sp. J31TS4 TaxID=2807195 RepID=UPI001B11A7DB|nr:helix-turn-helix domain-containing protein [Paenibacillus sp. J31TS4]GIP40120.1 transcriptional regulator [Paenibacillus sp. J31TS4]